MLPDARRNNKVERDKGPARGDGDLINLFACTSAQFRSEVYRKAGRVRDATA